MSGRIGRQPPVEPAAPRHGRMPRHGAFATYWKIVASVIAVLAVSAAAILAWATIDLLASLGPPVQLESEEMLDDVPDIGAMEGGLNFLLVGSDKRPEDGAFGDPDVASGVLNDVTMLLHISEDHSHAEVVSFPRDMIVSVPECPDPADPEGDPLPALEEEYLNAVLGRGGFGCVASTVEELTGVNIPAGGMVEFYGVAALSEAVGGVEVCVAEPIHDDYTGTHLDAGIHSLRGMDALQFLRTRHGVGDGSDLGRISNQQVFLSSLIRTLQSGGTLGDPVKLYSIAKAVVSNMTLSSALQDPPQLMAIARTLQDIDLSKIAFIQYPTAYIDGFASIVPSESADAVNEALQADVPVVLDPTATDRSEFGTVDPNAPSGEPETPEPEAPESELPPTAEASAPTESGTPPPGVLPEDVTGQTAADVRCSSGNGE